MGSICPFLNVSTKSTSSAAYSGSSKWRSKLWWIRFPSNRQPCGTWLWHGDHWYGQCFFYYSFWRGKRRRQAKLSGIRAQYIPGPFVKACEPVVGTASWVYHSNISCFKNRSKAWFVWFYEFIFALKMCFVIFWNFFSWNYIFFNFFRLF